MSDKRYYWLKLKEGYFNSPKIKKLRKIAGGDTYTIIYLKMQLLSISNNGIIEFEGIEPTFQEELALKLDEDVENVNATLIYIQSQGLIEESDNKFLLLEASDCIGSECDSAERVRLFRERKKEKMLQCNTSVTDVLQNSISISSSISNISNIKEKETKERKRFVKPTLEEVQAYCKERKNNVDAERFIDFYTSKGWKVGNQPMKDWKACVRTWENKDKAQKPQLMQHEFTKQDFDNIFDDIDKVVLK